MPLLEFSPHRIAGLTRANATLMARSRLTLIYAVVLPLLPFGLLLVGDNSSGGAGATPVTTALMMAALFPVYANLLSVVPPESWRAWLCGFPVGSRVGRGVLVVDRAHHGGRAVPAVVVVEPVAPVQHDGLGLAGVGEGVAG